MKCNIAVDCPSHCPGPWASLLAGQRAATAELLRLRGGASAHIANFEAARVCWHKRAADPQDRLNLSIRDSACVEGSNALAIVLGAQTYGVELRAFSFSVRLRGDIAVNCPPHCPGRWTSLLAGQRAASGELFRLRGCASAHIASFEASRVC